MPKKFGYVLRALFLVCILLCLDNRFAVADGNRGTVDGLYAYATSEGLPNGAVFGEVSSGKENDTLVSVASPVCDRIELHQMQETDGIMQMREVSSIPVGAAQKIVLGPMGYHLMLIKLHKPLADGQVFPVTVSFEKAGKKIIDVRVVSRAQ